MPREWAEMSDQDLLRAYAARQDVEAFSDFVGRHETALLSYAVALLRDEALAQDVVQEAFFRVARSPQRLFDAADSARHADSRCWLLKVVRDLSVDFLRRRAVERRVTDDLKRRPAEHAAAPDARSEVREEAGRVRAAIQRVPARSRELLLLKIEEGRSYKEIARITGLSVTNVGYILHQAMTRLTAELKEDEP